jgi:Nif-specific regulatory protein
MAGRPHYEDANSAVRICSLLDSLRALHQARHSAAVRDMLGKQIVALLREFVPADGGFVEVNENRDARPPHRGSKDRAARASNSARLSVAALENGSFRVNAPLLVEGRVAGALVLDRSQQRFTEPELLVLSAIVRMASLALENARHMEFLEDEVQRLRQDLHFEDKMIGASEPLAKLKRDIQRVASRDTTVLITGESGTGKELVARSIHAQSRRADAAFVAVNCAALTESLLESELFGYERGAFTGASALKRGLLEAANQGTIFLDEIGEMPLPAQAKLLRILQNRELVRVGGTESISLDVRVIAATNRDLDLAVRNRTFREDLFYRLNVVRLRTPSLRERPEDILPLAEHFARRFGAECGHARLSISTATRNVLRSYDWPGNVRELENAIEHAAVLGTNDEIQPEDLPATLLEHWAEAMPQESGMLQRAVNTAKKAAVKQAFEMAGGDHTQAARLLGVHPNYLYRLLRN